MFRYAADPSGIALVADSTLSLSRASSIVMLLAYLAYLVFQLWTHRKLFETPEVIGFIFLVQSWWHFVTNYGDFDDQDDDTVSSDDEPVIGFWSSLIWLIIMTGIIALLSEYVVGTIEVIIKSYPDEFNSDHDSWIANSGFGFLLLSGCSRILGYFCQLHQYNPVAHSWKRCRTCWSSHIRL